MASTEIRVPQNVKSGELILSVSRCGCGNPDQHRGVPCPTPARQEDIGRVAYYHRNWFLRNLGIAVIRVRDWLRNRGWAQVPTQYNPAPWDSDPELQDRLHNALADRWEDERTKVQHLPDEQVRAHLENWLKEQPEVRDGISGG